MNLLSVVAVDDFTISIFITCTMYVQCTVLLFKIGEMKFQFCLYRGFLSSYQETKIKIQDFQCSMVEKNQIHDKSTKIKHHEIVIKN